jgi:hypothetical protein
MVSVTPDGTATTERTIDGPRDTNGETPHAGRQEAASVRFDEEVDMVVLHGELENPEARV